MFCVMLCVCVFLGVVCECLAININTIYFALQKNYKKNKHEINDSRGMFVAGWLFVSSFLFLQLDLKKHTWPSQSCSVTRPFERLAVPRGMVVCQRKQSLFRRP